MRRIKNIELTKEDLIIAHLKSKASVEKKKILEKLIIKIKKLQKELQNSIDELQEIARLKRINKIETLRRKKLITAILKSEINVKEHNNNNNNNNDNDTYDGKIRGKIHNIKMILGRLGD